MGGSIITDTVEFSFRSKLRKKFSLPSETSSFMMVTLKHCLCVEGSEVKGIRGLLVSTIST